MPVGRSRVLTPVRRRAAKPGWAKRMGWRRCVYFPCNGAASGRERPALRIELIALDAGVGK